MDKTRKCKLNQFGWKFSAFSLAIMNINLELKATQWAEISAFIEIYFVLNLNVNHKINSITKYKEWSHCTRRWSLLKFFKSFIWSMSWPLTAEKTESLAHPTKAVFQVA